jgi:uncharacterized protein
MLSQEIIKNTETYVREQLQQAEAGHDWWHIFRVWRLARKIAEQETANLLVVELGALLHDIADAKFNQGDDRIGQEKARVFLKQQQLDDSIIEQVVAIVRDISYSTSLSREVVRTKELDIVQDADRLDAMGAIGIARTFSYGGFKGHTMHNPNLPHRTKLTKETYRKEDTTSLNHFYEKLLLLRDKMNTDIGKQLAEERHQFMQLFVKQFLNEWEGG